MVDPVGKSVEESLQRRRIGGVEGGGAPRLDIQRCALEPLGIPSSEDDLGALGARSSGRFQTDPGATANDDDSLAEQLRFAAHADGTTTCLTSAM